jgi:hypothetical protein
MGWKLMSIKQFFPKIILSCVTILALTTIIVHTHINQITQTTLNNASHLNQIVANILNHQKWFESHIMALYPEQEIFQT